MATYNKFNDFTEQLNRGSHNFGSNVYKIMLTNSPPNASTNVAKADITEIATGNGYTAGGNTTTITISESSGTTTISGTAVPFNATGTMAAFRYAVLYNATTTTPVLNPLVAWWDYGSSVTLLSGESFTVKFNNTDPGTIFTLV